MEAALLPDERSYFVFTNPGRHLDIAGHIQVTTQTPSIILGSSSERPSAPLADALYVPAW